MAYATDTTTGTITLTSGSVNFTTVGVQLQTRGHLPGDQIYVPEMAGWLIIATITGENTGTLTDPCPAAAAGAGKPVRIRFQSDGSRMTAAARALIEELGNGNVEALAGLAGALNYLPMFTGPGIMTLVAKHELVSGANYNVQVANLAGRAAYDGQTAGFAVLVSNSGDGRAAIYSKLSNTSGDWSAAAYVTGPGITLAIGDVTEVPFGTLPDVTVVPVAGGYNLDFDLPAAPTLQAGTTTTLPPGSSAAVTVDPVTGGYELNFEIPEGEGFDWAGVYDSGSAYDQDSVVRHNGTSFIAVQAVPIGEAPSSATPPVDTAYWEVVAARGTDGNITGVTTFWQDRLLNEDDLAEARTGLGTVVSGTPFGMAGIKLVVGSKNDAHYGFNNAVLDAGGGKWVIPYRKGANHGNSNGSELRAVDTYDGGKTFVNDRLIYTNASYDTRNFVARVMDGGRLFIATVRVNEAGAYTWPMCFYSDDAGVTWTQVELTMGPAATYQTNFHGHLNRYPASVGGHDTTGFIMYSAHSANGAVDAYSTVDNGLTWTFHADVATPSTGTCTEPSVVRVNVNDQWLMYARTNVADAEAIVFTSTDMLTWTPQGDCGLVLSKNPLQTIPDAANSKIWMTAFQRPEVGTIEAAWDNYLLMAGADAAALWAANGKFDALANPVNWSPLVRLPQRAVGYMHPFLIDGRWYATFVAGEDTPTLDFASLYMIGDFTPSNADTLTVSGDALERMFQEKVTPPDVLSGFRNKIINGDFHFWQRGTSTNSNGYGAADRWQLALSGATGTFSRQAFAVGQNSVPGNPRYFGRLEVTTGNDHCRLGHTVEDVRTLAGKKATFTFWAKGTNPGGGAVNLQIGHNYGTGGSPSTNNYGITVIPFVLTASWRKYTFLVDMPSLDGKVIGTDENSFVTISFGQATDASTAAWTLDLAHVSFVPGDATREDDPSSPRHIAQEEFLCERYYKRFQSEAAYDTFFVGALFQTTTVRFASIPINMRAVPTVSSSGAFRVLGHSTIQVDSIAGSTSTRKSGAILANITGGTIGGGAILQNSNDPTAWIAFEAELSQ